MFSAQYFAMIVVYADETGTQGLKKGGREPAPGVFGYMATPKMWEKFRGIWQSAMGKYDGVEYFHFRELDPNKRAKAPEPGKVNPYFGWNGEKVDNFIHEMAIAASTLPIIPFGGAASIKRLYAGRTDKDAHQGSYKVAFDQFFMCFSSTMGRHFPHEKDKVTFFFDDNDNEEWISILNYSHKEARKRDGRIAYEYVPIDGKSQKGMPCQAADLFAYIQRQQQETLFETGSPQKSRLLDIIISRHAFPKNHPRNELAKLSDAEWVQLISIARGEKKLKYAKDIAQGLPKQQFYPFEHSEAFKHHMTMWRAKYPKFFDEYGNALPIAI